MRLLASLFAVALLAACSTAPHLDPGPVVYACEGGTTLTVRFAPGMAYVSTGSGAELALAQQVAASGIWYATPQHSLRGKGEQATWTVGRKVPVQCRVRR